MLTVRGRAETLPCGGQTIGAGFAPEMIRIVPAWIGSFGIDAGEFDLNSRAVE